MSLCPHLLAALERHNLSTSVSEHTVLRKPVGSIYTACEDNPTRNAAGHSQKLNCSDLSCIAKTLKVFIVEAYIVHSVFCCPL